VNTMALWYPANRIHARGTGSYAGVHYAEEY
jgi:hypothetical protein